MGASPYCPDFDVGNGTISADLKNSTLAREKLILVAKSPDEIKEKKKSNIIYVCKGFSQQEKRNERRKKEKKKEEKRKK